MDASLMARMKELEDENRLLKKMYAEERLKAASKSTSAVPPLIVVDMRRP
jgi:hypothetical protein